MKTLISGLHYSIVALINDKHRLITILAVIILVLLSGISVFTSLNALQRNLAAEADSAITSLQASIGAIFENLIDEMVSESSGPLIRNALSDYDAHASLARPELAAIAQQQLISYVMLYDALSQPVVTAGKAPRSPETLQVTKEGVAEAIATGKITLKLQDEKQAILAAPVIYPPTGRHEGALIALIDLEALRARAIRPQVHNGHDIKIYFSQSTRLPGAQRPGLPDILSLEPSRYTRNFSLAAPLDDHSITIEHIADLHEERLALIYIIAAHLTIIILTLIALGLITNWIGKTYVIPVRQITAIAKKITGNNLADNPAFGRETISDLRQAVTQILESANTSETRYLEQINKAFTELDRTRDHLEQIAINGGVIAFSVNIFSGKIAYSPTSLSRIFDDDRIREGGHWRHLYSKLAPNQRNLIRLALSDCFRSGNSRIDIKVGDTHRERIYHIRIQPCLETDITQSRLDFIALDNTEKAQTERALIGSESRKAAIINAAIDGLITLDMDYVITEINPAAERIFKRRNINLLGQSFTSNCLAPGASQQFISFINSVNSGEGAHAMTALNPIWCITGESKTIPVELNASIVNSDTGKQIVLYLKDLEDTHRQQQEINRKNAEISIIFDMSPDGLASFDVHGRLSSHNKALIEMLEWPPEKLRHGLSHQEFKSMLESATQKRSLKRFAKNLSADEGIIALNAPKPKLLKYSKKSPDSSNSGKSCIYYFKDITQEFQLDSMKSSFLATAAHELRTPLTTILGFSEFLTTSEVTPDEQQELLGNIYRQSINLSLLLNDLLDLAKIEADGANLMKVSRQSLRDLLFEIYEGSTTIRNNNRYIEQHELLLLLDEDEPLTALVDVDKIRRAILNLVNNAAKYSPAESPITIVATYVSADEPSVMISVIDKGIGMTNEELDHAFERFWRADSTSGNIPGTGLGLPLVREIMDMHKGRVELHSVYGSGTTAVLTIPVNDPGTNA